MVVLIAVALPVACVSLSAGSENDRVLLARSSAGESPPNERSDRPLKGERPRRTPPRDGVQASVHSRVLKLEEEQVPMAGAGAPPPEAGDAPPPEAGDAPPPKTGDAPPLKTGDAPPLKTGDAPPPEAPLAKAKEGKSKKKSSKSMKSAKAAKVISDVHIHYSIYQFKPEPSSSLAIPVMFYVSHLSIF